MPQRGTPHQFVPLTMARAVLRVTPRIRAAGGMVVLDLEDSVQDPFDDGATAELKSTARAALLDLGARSPAVFADGLTSVRINEAGSSHHDADLAALAVVCKQVPLDSIWLPKVESADGIKRLLASLPEPTCVRPIIETRAGVDQLPKILEDATSRVRAVVFGHIDFSLDTGAWPFPGADDVRLWEAAGGVIDRVEGSGRTYIHTAVTEIENDDLLSRVQATLAQRCRAPFGQTSLSLRQTQVAAKPAAGPELVLRAAPVQSEEQRLASARQVIELFEASRCRRRSFALDAASGRFLPPHEYRAALRILSEGRQPS